MKLSLTLLSILCFFAFGNTQSNVPQEYKNSLDATLESIFAESIIPGISASVNFKASGTWNGVGGISYEGVPIDTNMLFGMASNTKLFTAAICVKMAHHGYFSLDDPLSKWLDTFQYVDPKITVKQLLQHNSGLNDFINNTDLFPGQVLINPTKTWTPEETLSYILSPITTPNNGIFYSNANYILAAMVLESATGLAYVDLVRDSIFKPLELPNVYFDGFDEYSEELVHPYFFGTDYASTPRTALGTITWSAGALITKPSTLTKWYNYIFNESFLDQSLLAEIMDFVEWPDDPEMKMMGLGLYKLNINDRIYYGHGGRTIGYSSYTLYDVENGNSICVATNEFLSDALSIALVLAEKSNQLLNMETSVSDIKDFPTFYPNPARQMINLENHTQANIYDSSGNFLLSSEGANHLPLGNLSSGMYFLRIEKNNMVKTHKLFITE